MVVTDIKQCLNELEEEMVAVPVELVDPSVAMIYAKSKRGKVSVCVMVNVVLEYISGIFIVYSLYNLGLCLHMYIKLDL